MSREAILKQIRAALGTRAPQGATHAERRSAIDTRLARPPSTLLPERATLPAQARIAQFENHLRAQGTVVLAAVGRAQIPAAIADYLRANELPLRLRKGADAFLGNVPWQSAGDLVFAEDGPADPSDEVGLSRASAGVAETGTLVLASGVENPVTLAFLPETHIVVLAKSAIVGSYEDAMELVAAELTAGGTPGQMPRTLNLITGASRTGDIGGRIVMGAHGPRRLVVVIVDEG
jgi:L-lactate dehydrogenase complex protein LldG